MKTCTRCLQEKPYDQFHNQKSQKDGKQPHCRACQAVAAAKYRAENKEKIAASKKAYHEANKDKISVRAKSYRTVNSEKLRAQKSAYSAATRDKRKAYDAANAEKISKRDKAYRQKNIDRITARHAAHKRKNRAEINEYQKKRYREDSLYVLRVTYRTRILDAMRRGKYTKRSKTSHLLGCTCAEFKAHLESLFLPGMTWENRGKYGWHIDHIIPLGTASTQEDIERLCHYTNTQPLWAEDNHRKGCKIL